MDASRATPFGTTRSHVERNHALIAPDSHVVAPLCGWRDAAPVVLVSPAMGAGFTQYLVNLRPSTVGDAPPPGTQRFLYGLSGTTAIETDGDEISLTPGAYAWLPPDRPHRVRAVDPGRVLVFEKRYAPLDGIAVPGTQHGLADDVPGEPFLGDPDACLQTLLPGPPAFDLAVNVFTYQPGATLPFVEVHVMEHGLLMLSGAGVYRLDESWYPVCEGDCIWMGPYCAQWFAATGKTPASYIYYKDVHRDPGETPT